MIILGVICVIVLIVIIGKIDHRPFQRSFLNSKIRCPHLYYWLPVSPQYTSAPKKSRSYPSLISASLLLKQKQKKIIDSQINRQNIVNYIYVSSGLASIQHPSTHQGPIAPPLSQPRPGAPRLYLSCECAALASFWVLLAFLTCHSDNQTLDDDATTEKETTIGDNCYITDIYSSL